MSAAESLARIAGAVERLERRGPELEPYRQPGKDYDLLGRQVPRNPFAGTAGLALALRLGMARQFRKLVPEPEHRLGPWVLCRCEELFTIDRREVRECPGGCGRWYLRTEESVRWALWGEPDA